MKVLRVFPRRTNATPVDDVVHIGSPDVLGFNSTKSILIECKTSLADFNRDFKKSVRAFPELGVGRFRWYLAPEGIIYCEQIPEKWGLLEISETKTITCVKEPEEQDQNKDAEIVMLVSFIRRSKKK